jgi:diguanylate cyclase (GGDEF)-like protein
MKRTRVTTHELLERVLPVASLDQEGLRLWKAAASSGGETDRLAATAALLDRLCDLGRMRKLSKVEADGRVEIRYRDLSKLDVIALAVPRTLGPRPPAGVPPAHGIPEAPPSPQGATPLPHRLLEAVAASSRRIDLAGALNHLFDLLRGALGCERVSLRISTAVGDAQLATLTELDDVLRAAGGSAIAPDETRRRVEESGELLHVPDLAADAAFSKHTGGPARGSLIVAPLKAEGYVYGILELWRSVPRAFDAEALAAAGFVAEFAAGLIKRRLEVEELVFIDQTTQIHNRRYFEEQLEREIERCRRTGNSMALLIADLDDFKRVNDTLGHAAGDSVLRQAARILTDNARQVDIVARYGGEEFCVLLPDVTRETAKAVADRILWTIARHHFATGNESSPTWELTVSIGGALYPIDAQTKALLIDRADRVALYAAKRAGKNRVVFWDDSGTESR